MPHAEVFAIGVSFLATAAFGIGVALRPVPLMIGITLAILFIIRGLIFGEAWPQRRLNPDNAKST